MTQTTTQTRDAVRAAGVCAVHEQRTLPLGVAQPTLVRAADDGAVRFGGHAAVFESRTSIGDPLTWGWYEEVGRSAFDKTLAEGDARFLVDHDSRMIVARRSAGDLRLSTDAVGLAVDADLDDELSYVRDLRRNVEKRRITGMSFGFQVIRDTWAEITVPVDIDGEAEERTVYLRSLDEVRLLEVSAVTFPAYDDTDAGLRSMALDIRAARGVPTERPAPSADQAGTRDQQQEQHDPAPASTTRGAELDERARALAIRYRLPR